MRFLLTKLSMKATAPCVQLVTSPPQLVPETVIASCQDRCAMQVPKLKSSALGNSECLSHAVSVKHDRGLLIPASRAAAVFTCNLIRPWQELHEKQLVLPQRLATPRIKNLSVVQLDGTRKARSASRGSCQTISKLREIMCANSR